MFTKRCKESDQNVTKRCRFIFVAVCKYENGENFESTTYYDMDLLKSAEARQVWLLRNESNYYALSAQDRRSQVQPVT